MRSLAAWLVPVVLCSCAATPVPQTLPPPAPVLSAPAPVVAPPASIDARNVGNLPANAAAVASIDAAKLSSMIASLTRTMRPEYLNVVERAFNLPSGSVASGQLASGIGVDPSRPILFSVAPLGPHGRAILSVGTLRDDQLAQKVPSPGGAARAIEKALNSDRTPPTHLRIVVPSSDNARLLSAIHGLLDNRRYAKVATPPELESIYARRERVVVLSLGPSRVVVDIFAFAGALPRPKTMAEVALATLRELKDNAGSQAPALEGHVARLSYSPQAVAQIGFVEALSRANDLLGSGSEYTLDWRMATAIRYAAALLTLAGGKQAAFDRVDLTIHDRGGLPSVVARADVGPGLTVPSGAACAPRISVDFPGALARFDIATSCMRAVPVPGDPPDGGLHQRAAFSNLIEQAGWVGWPVALPFYVFGATRIPLRWYAGVGPRAMQRFERFGWANPQFGAPDVFWGLLPAGAKPEDIACSVAEDAKACKAKRRIKPAGVSDIGGAFARVVTVDSRTVVLASRDRGAVEAMTPKLTAAPVPVFRGAVSSGTVQRQLSELGIKLDPAHYVGDAVVENKQVTVTIAPVVGP